MDMGKKIALEEYAEWEECSEIEAAACMITDFYAKNGADRNEIWNEIISKSDDEILCWYYSL